MLVKIMFVFIFFFPCCAYSEQNKFLYKGPPPMIDEMIVNLAVGKEAGYEWREAQRRYSQFYGHPPGPMGILEQVNLLNLDAWGKDKKNKYVEYFENYKDLPAPPLWKLLDRKKGIMLEDLNYLSFPMAGCGPIDKYGELGEKEFTKITFDKPPKEYLLISFKKNLLAILGEQLKSPPKNWKVGWKEAILKELQRRYEIKPETFGDWYIKEGIRVALELAKGVEWGKTGEVKNRIWQSEEYKKWYKEWVIKQKKITGATSILETN